MKKVKWLLFSLCSLCLFSSAQAQSDTLLNRYREYLLRTGLPSTEDSGKWQQPLTSQGTWQDIDYKNQEPAVWKTDLHLKRVREMAFAWADPASVYYRNQELFQKITPAVDHWVDKRYQSGNWWHNEIGIPRCMRDIIILLREELNAPQMQGALSVMGQLRVREDFVGGNLVWCADLGLHYGALTRNAGLVSRCRGLLLREIKITTGEGVQPDYSFHQHGKRLQMYQYGKAYLTESLRLAWQLRGTSLAFPEKQVQVLFGLVTEGWQWMARGIYTVPGTMDRSASRKGELRAADLHPLLPFMRELLENPSPALSRLGDIQNGKGALRGYRYYPYSDFTAYHRPGFSYFLKTISTRTYPTESINGENLKGGLLNSGDAYLIRSGKEYTDLMPVWDWAALPGVTAFQGARQVSRKSFAGSVSDSVCGLTAMDYVLQDSSGSRALFARKFWACHGDRVVCLIAGIKSVGRTGELYTALDQCRWQGRVEANGRNDLVREGRYDLADVKWIYHAGIAYLPLRPSSVRLHLMQVAGTWSLVNASESRDTIREKVFRPLLMHQQGSSSGYTLALAKTPGKARALARRPDWKVVRNDSSAQAVLFHDGVLMAAFYRDGTIDAGKGLTIAADQPCLLLVKKGRVYASDPTHRGITLNSTIQGKAYTCSLPSDGVTLSWSITAGKKGLDERKVVSKQERGKKDPGLLPGDIK